VKASSGPVVDVPPAVDTVMSTVPDPDGEVAVHDVVETQVAGAPVVPKVAVVAPGTNPAPVTVTTVPPASGPAAGETPETVGVAS
jgi:hypothetical protein